MITYVSPRFLHRIANLSLYDAIVELRAGADRSSRVRKRKTPYTYVLYKNSAYFTSWHVSHVDQLLAQNYDDVSVAPNGTYTKTFGWHLVARIYTLRWHIMAH